MGLHGPSGPPLVRPAQARHPAPLPKSLQSTGVRLSGLHLSGAALGGLSAAGTELHSAELRHLELDLPSFTRPLRVVARGISVELRQLRMPEVCVQEGGKEWGGRAGRIQRPRCLKLPPCSSTVRLGHPGFLLGWT